VTPRLVVVSHTGRATGFGRVAAGIATALGTQYDVHVVGLGSARTREPWTAHGHDERFDPTRTSAAERVTADVRPDAAILVGEGRATAWMVTSLRRSGFGGGIAAYVPVEANIGHPSRLAGLADATLLVAYTEIGRAALTRALALGPPVTTIPHGIDRAGRTRGGPQSRDRRNLLPAHEDRSEGIWVLNANRNDRRKRPELTLEAFAEVARQRPDATLVMHCAPRRPGMDLRIERDRLGVRDSVILTREADTGAWTDARLARLYAACEVGISSATGEGWGLVAFEHSLRGGAQILPGHPGLREIWGDAPEWVPTAGEARCDHVFVGAVPSVESMSSALLSLVDDRGRREAVATACAARAGDPQLGWDEVGARWRAVAERLVSPPRGLDAAGLRVAHRTTAP
jgi:D-inositol-3-phosphate glycosyltransferase